jgi:hypothetical protein
MDKMKTKAVIILIITSIIVLFVYYYENISYIDDYQYFSEKNKVSLIFKDINETQDTLFFEKYTLNIVNIVKEEENDFEKDNPEIYFDEPICNVSFYVLDGKPKYTTQIDFPNDYILNYINKKFINKIMNRLFREKFLNSKTEIGLKVLLPKEKNSLDMPLPPSMIN